MRELSEVDRNIGVVRRLEEAFNRRDYAALRALVSDDIEAHNPGGSDVTAEGLQSNNEHWHSALPDKWTEVLDAFGEGDRVVARIRDRGTNTGGVPWFGVPANGAVMDIEWLQITRHGGDGRVVEMWALADVPGLLAQLGVAVVRQEAAR
jgi:predicted ester cyclase